MHVFFYDTDDDNNNDDDSDDDVHEIILYKCKVFMIISLFIYLFIWFMYICMDYRSIFSVAVLTLLSLCVVGLVFAIFFIQFMIRSSPNQNIKTFGTFGKLIE